MFISSLSHRLEAMACFFVSRLMRCVVSFTVGTRKEKKHWRRRSSREGERKEMSSCQDQNGLVTVSVLHCGHCASLNGRSAPRHVVVCLVSSPHTALSLCRCAFSNDTSEWTSKDLYVCVCSEIHGSSCKKVSSPIDSRYN